MWLYYYDISIILPHSLLITNYFGYVNTAEVVLYGSFVCFGLEHNIGGRKSYFGIQLTKFIENYNRFVYTVQRVIN